MRHSYAELNTLDVVFRPACLSDSGLLLKWRNDPATRMASLETEAVPFDEHVAWLTRSLAMDLRRIYIAEISGWAVGTIRTDVRVDVDFELTELSWTVSPDFRGYGIGTAMVSQFVARLPGHLVAQVKHVNEASQRIALKAGFSRTQIHDGLVQFERAA